MWPLPAYWVLHTTPHSWPLIGLPLPPSSLAQPLPGRPPLCSRNCQDDSWITELLDEEGPSLESPSSVSVPPFLSPFFFFFQLHGMYVSPVREGSSENWRNRWLVSPWGLTETSLWGFHNTRIPSKLWRIEKRSVGLFVLQTTWSPMDPFLKSQPKYIEI